MVMDFGDLKRIVNSEIVDRLDHSFVLRDSEQNEELREVLGAKFNKVVLVDYQPTCENMLADFAERLQRALPATVQLYSLRLHETATSYAEWYASDN
jgi:6-pyruvoyltetrahydropterin/6-carboxytetrahydropterin synthase